MTHKSSTPPRRNILLVVAEDMGPQLGAYGCPDARTPHLDRFAENSARFETTWCDAPMCSPARAAMLTGLPAHENGTFGLSTHRFSTFPKVPSLPELLSQAGYRTGLIGKLHVLPEWRFPFGFRWAELLRFSHNSNGGRDYRRMLTFADAFMDDDSAPFFLMVALPDAHVPYLRQSYGEPKDPISGSEVGIVPGMDKIIPQWQDLYADYHNCIRRVDTAFGGLMEALDRRGLKENTTVIFTSDHGLQFPRGKLNVYEPGISVPLLVGGAGVNTAGRAISTPACGVDIFSTILDTAGVEAPPIARGQSLLKIAAEADEDRYIFAGTTACMPALYFPQRVVRNRRFKLIRSFLPGRENPCYQATQTKAKSGIRAPIPPLQSLTSAMRQAYETWRMPPEFQLYDLQQDPLETINRSGDPTLATEETELRRQLLQWLQRTDDFVLDAERREHFEKMIARYLESPPAAEDHRYFEWEYVTSMRPKTLPVEVTTPSS